MYSFFFFISTALDSDPLFFLVHHSHSLMCFALPVRTLGGYSHTLPIRVCAAQRGRDFEAPDLERGVHFRGVFLERGIIFRKHEISSSVSSHLKLFKDRLLLKILFNALTSKLLYPCRTLYFSVQNGYKF